MAKLVGQPHLLGQMKPLRNGYLVEPLGVLTLLEDGRVSGQPLANQRGWSPYGHGDPAATAAFALLTEPEGWIPSSTWTQSLDDMPIGFYCDEPEADLAVRRLCLVPQVVSSDALGIIYLVASCLNYYERTVPPLLMHLRAEGIPSHRIKVVVNGCQAAQDRQIDGIDYAFSTHDGWEWSALYEAPLRWHFDYAFLMHDTSLVFPGFRRSVETFNRHIVWDHLPASPLARCLLGLYSHDFLSRLNPWLARTDRISKQQGILAEVGAELLLRARTALAMGDLEQDGVARATQWRETVDWFSTGKLRRRRVFPAIKLHKFINMSLSRADTL